MASPTLKVEIAFTSDPLDTTPTWVDVTQYVRATSGGGGGVQITRGHGMEIGPFEAGSCRVTLSNRDRRFDPSHAAGPNFGNLIPRKQIRITATWATVDYVMFSGFVTGWPQDFSNYGEDATVTIEAIDPLALLANMNLPDDLVYDYADGLTGLALFLRQADTSNWSDATDNGYSANPTIGIGRTSGSLAPGMSTSAVAFDGATYWTTQKYTSTAAFTFSFWLQTTQTNTVGTLGVLFSGVSDDATRTSYISLNPVTDTVSNIAVTLAHGGGGNLIIQSPLEVPINDGMAHHVVVTSDGVSAAHLYVDGADVSTLPTFTEANPMIVNRIGAHYLGASFYSGTIQDVAAWDQELTALEVEGMYQRSYGFLQEGSADRITRLLDDVGWPAAWREITTNPRASVGELVYNGSSVLPKLQEVEVSEQGMLFATKAGFVAFRERYYANEVTVGNTVQQIFSDDNGATALPFSTFGFQWNDIDITNDATVTTPDTWAKSSDATSITVNGRQSKKVDTILSTFDQANTLAAGLVAEGKDATYRVPPIMVYPANNDTRWDEVLGLELGYRVSVEITPMGVGSQNAQEVTLEQIEWSIVDTLWTFTMAGSPCFGTAGVAAEVGWFTIGVSLIGGPDVIGF